MVLTLEVIGPEASQLGRASQKVFRACGGTIGRLSSNDLALPDADQIVSNRHAVIAYQNGAFSIEDRSTNGTYLNAPNNRLRKGEPHPLKAGDRIFIPPYQIKVSIAPDAAPHASSASASSPFDDIFGEPGGYGTPAPEDHDPFGLSRPVPAAPPRQQSFDADALVGSEKVVDPMELLGLGSGGEAPPARPRAEHLANSSPLSDPYRAPAIVPPPPDPGPDRGGMIPDDWDREPSGPVPGAAPPAPRAAVPARPAVPRPGTARPRGASIDLAEVLAGAGLEGVPVTPELARNFGQILRVVVAGVMDVLQARQELKTAFGMMVTIIKPTDNNPLKFSANVEDALHNLLVKRNPAFLGPVDAFDDAFTDIRHHQLAMLQAVRQAFDAMLAEFDPDRLQKIFEERNKGSLLSVPAKLRYWDQYCDRIRAIVSDPDASFRELFGDEFATAYEQQLQRLRAQRRQP